MWAIFSSNLSRNKRCVASWDCLLHVSITTHARNKLACCTTKNSVYFLQRKLNLLRGEVVTWLLNKRTSRSKDNAADRQLNKEINKLTDTQPADRATDEQTSCPGLSFPASKKKP